MVLYITIGVLSILVILLVLIIINLLKKNEKQEDILIGYLTYLDNISRVVEFSDKKLQTLDDKGLFKSDDEIGFFFENVKAIQDILNQFKIEDLK